jgi:ketosteroid isomerase-like protein
MKIPSIIGAFIKASNEHDSNAVVACFADHAVVHDEAKEMRGATAIKEWSDQTSEKYQFTIEPTALVEGDQEIILTATVSGNFPGSPISLDFEFTVKNNQIVTLTIR